MTPIPKEGKRRKNKNTPARFSQKAKEDIFERDGGRCIFSSQEKPWSCSRSLHFHHALYGFEGERGSDRNDVDKGVALCEACHTEMHHGISGFVRIIRQFCKDYLLNYYND